MTKQEAFDKALAGIRAQGKPSMKTVVIKNEFGTRSNIYCAYRGDNGLRCAIGFLIPDELYNPEWDAEETKVEKLALRHELDFLGLSVTFMQDLQLSVHDQPAARYGDFLTLVESGAKAFAVGWGLEYKEPTHA